MYRTIKTFTVIGLLVVSVFALSISHSSHVVSAQTDTKALAQAWVDAQNAAFKSGDPTAFVALYSPDYVDPTVPAGTSPLDSVKQNTIMLVTAFPDGKLEVKDIVASSDEAAVYVTVSGTNTGLFAGVPPTGKAFSGVNIIDILTFKDGKIVKDVSVADTASLFSQLGWTVAPPAGGSAPAPTAAK
ncbi:MAG: ester cyclase [Chloroflexota bacterium]